MTLENENEFSMLTNAVDPRETKAEKPIGTRQRRDFFHLARIKKKRKRCVLVEVSLSSNMQQSNSIAGIIRNVIVCIIANVTS